MLISKKVASFHERSKSQNGSTQNAEKVLCSKTDQVSSELFCSKLTSSSCHKHHERKKQHREKSKSFFIVIKKKIKSVS